MDLFQLEVLVAVAEEHGFSRAAERLLRTQPAISQAIRRLEEELGELLFDRTSNTGSLTACGQVLYEYAIHLLNLRREAETAVKELKDVRAGKLLVGANEYGVTYLLDAIKDFRVRYPLIKVHIKRSLAAAIPSQILSRETEIGVVSYRPTQETLTVMPVARDETVLIIPPKHPLANRHVVSVRDLGDERFIAQSVTSPYRERVVQTFQTHHIHMIIPIELPTLESIKSAVVQGLGVAFIPKLTASKEIERGELKAVRVREMNLERQLYLIFRKGGRLSHAAQAFLSIVRSA